HNTRGNQPYTTTLGNNQPAHRACPSGGIAASPSLRRIKSSSSAQNPTPTKTPPAHCANCTTRSASNHVLSHRTKERLKANANNKRTVAAKRATPQKTWCTQETHQKLSRCCCSTPNNACDNNAVSAAPGKSFFTNHRQRLPNACPAEAPKP